MYLRERSKDASQNVFVVNHITHSFKQKEFHLQYKELHEIMESPFPLKVWSLTNDAL